MEDPERKKYAKEFAALGGKAVWAKMTPEERTLRGKKMNAARLAKRAREKEEKK